MEGLSLGEIVAGNLENVTAKSLYQGYTTAFPPPIFDVEWPLVWSRLVFPVFEPLSREYIFMIVNNVVPNK